MRRSWWAVTGREQRLIMTLTTCNTDETVRLFIFINTSVPCSMCVLYTVHCVCVHTVHICVCACVHVCVCTYMQINIHHTCNTSSLSNCSFVSFQFWMFLSPPTGTTSLLMSSICVPYSVHNGQLNLLPPLVVILSDHGTHLGCKAILYSTGSGRGSPKVQQAWQLSLLLHIGVNHSSTRAARKTRGEPPQSKTPEWRHLANVNSKQCFEHVAQLGEYFKINNNVIKQ